MNLSKVLKNTSFTDDDIAKMNLFIIGVHKINNIYFTESENNDSLHIMGNIHYIFNKNNKKDSFLLYSINNDIFTTYNFHNNEFYPSYAYIDVDGKLTGKGNHDKEKIRRDLFKLLYLDDEIKLFIILPSKGRIIKEITVGIETVIMERAENMDAKEIKKIIKYFSIDLERRLIQQPSSVNYFKHDIFYNANRMYSKNCSDTFLEYISIGDLLVNPYSIERKEEYLKFISIYKMITM